MRVISYCTPLFYALTLPDKPQIIFDQKWKNKFLYATASTENETATMQQTSKIDLKGKLEDRGSGFRSGTDPVVAGLPAGNYSVTFSNEKGMMWGEFEVWSTPTLWLLILSIFKIYNYVKVQSRGKPQLAPICNRCVSKTKEPLCDTLVAPCPPFDGKAGAM